MRSWRPTRNKYFGIDSQSFKPSSGHIRNVESGCEWALSQSIHMSWTGGWSIKAIDSLFFLSFFLLSFLTPWQKIAWGLVQTYCCLIRAYKKKFLLSQQVLQLQMNDYKYHYLFTTFVSVTIFFNLRISSGRWYEKEFASQKSLICLECDWQDVEIFDLEAFKYNYVNITAFRAVDSEYFRVMQTLKEMERVQMPGYNQSVINRTRILQVSF